MKENKEGIKMCHSLQKYQLNIKETKGEEMRDKKQQDVFTANNKMVKVSASLSVINYKWELTWWPGG